MFSHDSLTIEKKLRVEDFRFLRQRFNRATVDGADYSTKETTKIFGKTEYFHCRSSHRSRFLGSLNKEEFIEAFESILDLTQYKNQLEKLFDKVE